VKFFFPDSQDQVDPFFDMLTEEHRVHRIRQRDDAYAHEILRARPFDGLLLTKPIIDGRTGGAGAHYTAGARQRLYRDGVREFFRLDASHCEVLTMGDCGAFTYANERDVPYKVDEVIDFYEGCGFDRGVAPDHIIFGFYREGKSPDAPTLREFKRRARITRDNARHFLERHAVRRCSFEPMAAAHGWNVESYKQSVEELIAMGYKRIAMGGMVPLRTIDILDSLEAVSSVLNPSTELHLLGVTRVNEMNLFMEYGVTSFDSTSPFFQAFKDENDNYYLGENSYMAIRIPQVDGNAAIKREIKAGRVDQWQAMQLERKALDLVRRYAERKAGLDEALVAVLEYESLLPHRRERSDEYRRTLQDRPWENCKCGVCDTVGIEVVLFRGSERNKRRGFHNLTVFRERLDLLEISRRKRGRQGGSKKI
jgi:hypothetical protein